MFYTGEILLKIDFQIFCGFLWQEIHFWTEKMRKWNWGNDATASFLLPQNGFDKFTLIAKGLTIFLNLLTTTSF